MPKSTSLYFTQNLKTGLATLTNSDGTTAKTLCTGGTNDSVVKSLMVVSDDTSARVVNVYLNAGSGSDFLLGSVSVPITAGSTGAIAGIDLLGGTLLPGLPYDTNGKRVLPLPAGYIVKVAVQVAVTSTKTLTFTALLEDY